MLTKVAKIKIPLVIRRGMKLKALERVAKKTQDAKDIGMYNAALPDKLRQQESVLANARKPKKSLKVDILTNNGRIKGGVMNVPKRMIAMVENKNKKARSAKNSKPNHARRK